MKVVLSFEQPHTMDRMLNRRVHSEAFGSVDEVVDDLMKTSVLAKRAGRDKTRAFVQGWLTGHWRHCNTRYRHEADRRLVKDRIAEDRGTVVPEGSLL
jgi:hypothetical protein